MNWNSLFKKALKILLGLFLVLFVLALILLTTVDRSPIEQQEFYKETFERLDETPFQTTLGETWMAGWHG
jgi:hypothetical protein